MQVPVVDINVCPMDTPSDMSTLRALLDSGTLDPSHIVAVIGKTEGTGLGKDIGRETADLALRELLADRLGIEVAAVADRICLILSGGTPGVLTPHLAVVTRQTVDIESDGASDGARLVVGRASSADIEPEEIGRMPQIRKVATAVDAAMRDAGLTDAADVHAVLVKAPSLTEASIADAYRRGFDTVTHDLSVGAEGAMCYSNDASALGVAAALGEVPPDSLSNDVVRRDWTLYSDVAMTSSGGEKRHAEVVVLGNRRGAGGELRIGHSSMRDILDVAAVQRALNGAGLPGACPVDDGRRERIVYLMAKMVIPGSSRLDGRRITLLDDPVGYHVAKAMGGYLLATQTQCTAAFVSGGERNSHQGPPDGNPLAAIVRVR
jgi:cyanuric acid amidohydrolase